MRIFFKNVRVCVQNLKKKKFFKDFCKETLQKNVTIYIKNDKLKKILKFFKEPQSFPQLKKL